MLGLLVRSVASTPIPRSRRTVRGFLQIQTRDVRHAAQGRENLLCNELAFLTAGRDAHHLVIAAAFDSEHRSAREDLDTLVPKYAVKA